MESSSPASLTLDADETGVILGVRALPPGQRQLVVELIEELVSPTPPASSTADPVLPFTR